MSIKEQSIEIDCAPMTPRPDTYITGVLEGTVITGGKIVSKLFGNWKWDFGHIDEKVWEKAQPVFKQRLEKLHAEGRIRYASW